MNRPGINVIVSSISGEPSASLGGSKVKKENLLGAEGHRVFQIIAVENGDDLLWLMSY